MIALDVIQDMGFIFIHVCVQDTPSPAKFMHINGNHSHKLPSIESCDASCVIAAACLYGKLAKNALNAELCVRV